jgi:ABC-type protease/lipase transport system fused ATPase/permease subunit
MAYAMQLQQAAEAQQAADNNGGGQPGGNVMAKNLSFHPPGAEKPLLNKVSFNLKPNQLGLIIGRSGESNSAGICNTWIMRGHLHAVQHTQQSRAHTTM